MRRGIVVAISALVLGALLGWAITQRGERIEHSPERAAEAAVPTAPRPPAVAARPPAEPEIPELGTVVVERGASGVNLFANSAPRFDVLIALAQAFDVELIDHARAHPLVTLSLVDRSVEEILTRVLDDTPYRLRYELAGDERGVKLATLEVAGGTGRDRVEGDFDVAKDLERQRRPDGESDRRKGEDDDEDPVASTRQSRVLTDSEYQRFLAERAARNERRRAELIDELQAPDAEVRAFAAASLDADRAEDRLYLEDLLINDKDPKVRKEAAQQLGFGDPSMVLPKLEEALSDPDPTVVTAAVISLGFLDHPSAIPWLEPLASHQDPIVRETANRVINLLSTAR